MPAPNPWEHAARLLNPTRTPHLAELEADWERWVRQVLGPAVTADFAAHHRLFWEWVWQIRPGERPRPLVNIWSRGAAKSTSAEGGVVALGARRRRRYALYVCHETGTQICDPDLGWTTVDDHPTARRREGEPGIEVEIAGLRFPETVTREHRYWARRIARRGGGHGLPTTVMTGRPTWIEAQDLDWNTWIGLPIDQTVTPHTPVTPRWNHSPGAWADAPIAQLDDPEFWWAVGLWWGDGTLGGARNSQVSWCMADRWTDRTERLMKLLATHGYQARNRTAGPAAMSVVTVGDSQLSRWLWTWKQGRNRKCPPEWVEQLPHESQANLIRGYLDADGYVDERWASLTSIHLPGLLAVRRMLARLGVPSQIGARTAARESTIEGRTYLVQPSYVLRFAENATVLGYDLDRGNDWQVRDLFIADGCLWSRVKKVVPVEDRTFVAITTSTGDYLTHFGRSHNCSTQDAADQHVANIGAILESKRLADLYPDMADRDVNKFGSSRGWRHNRLAAKSGFTVDALGLDTQVRGVKFDEQRPDLIVIDDIDEAADAPAAIAKKIELLTKAVLPAGSTDLAVLAIQNLIHRDGIFGRMAGVSEEPADFLGDRIMSGPIPAIEGLEWVEEVWPSGQARYRITHGSPTWAGMDLAICQAMIDSGEGLTAFLTERQHLAEPPSGGLWKEDFRFAHCNPDDVPELVVVECSVDPAVTDTDHSDRHAIQVDGLASDGTIYRLHSWEARTSPEDSLRRAIRLALAYGAMSVGVETDNGRDTWQSVYRAALAQAQAELADEATADGVEVEPVTWPHYREVLASKALGSKAARAQRMLADYERPGRIVHVRGTHEVLERALRRFPRTKPFDLTDAAYHNWAHLDKRRGGAGRTSARQLARARLPV